MTDGKSVNGDKKVDFMYDYLGRRVGKIVQTWSGGAWVNTTSHYFIYDGWQVVMVLDGLADPQSQEQVVSKYTWGLDLSSTRTGAGGIGGLLAAVATQGTTATTDDDAYWFCYDANGNVSDLLRYETAPDTVTLAAHYEYDPYGNTLVIADVDSSGLADANPIRFSTKWYDAETGMYYYGRRYYLPRIGRWGSNDPIGELGGANLYAFVRNHPIGFVDYLGLMTQAQCINFWSPFFTSWLTTRTTRDTYWSWQLKDLASQQALIAQLNSGAITQAQFDAQWEIVTSRRTWNYERWTHLNHSLRDGFEWAMLGRWMTQVGCGCEGLRQATISVKHRGFAKAFNTLSKLPTGTGPADVATYIIDNVLARGKPGKGIWSLLENVAMKNLYYQARNCCSSNFPPGPERAADLYVSTPDVEKFNATTPEAIPLD